MNKNISQVNKVFSLLTRKEKKQTVILFFFIIFSMFLEILGIGLILPVVTLISIGDIAEKFPRLVPMLEILGTPSRETLVIYVLIIVVITYAFKNIFLAILVWLQVRFSYQVQLRLSQLLFKLFLSQPYTFHLQKNSAELFRNITSDVNYFTSYGITPCMTLLSEGLVLIGITILLLNVEPLGAIIVMLALGIAALVFQKVTKKRIIRWGEERQYHNKMQILHLQQGLAGVKDIKVLGRESEFIQKFQKHNTKNAKINILQTIFHQLPRIWLEMLVTSGLALFVIAMILQGNKLDVILPTLSLFAVAAFRIMPSVNRLINGLQSLRFGLPVINTLYDQLKSLVLESEYCSNGIKLFNKNIELKQIIFSYTEDEDPVVKTVSMEIFYGETIGLVGQSGAGKSTIVDIILGLLKPQKGTVLVDGKDINDNVRAWQSQIGYVPQTIFLTDDTIRKNIAFGVSDEDICEDALRKAVVSAQLQGFIKGLPNGLDTIVGEKGVRLSGGQRQRIGIARALYHNPSVLILDEATSSLDTATEASFMEDIRKLHGEKTIIIVAHRLSTVENSDRLYHIEKGQIINQGKPEIIIPSLNINNN